jgi:hypothetical protein
VKKPESENSQKELLKKEASQPKQIIKDPEPRNEPIKKVEKEPEVPEPPKEQVAEPLPPEEPTKESQVAVASTNAGPTEVTVTPDMIVVALADFEATAEDQLTLVEGQLYVRITEDYGNGWSLGCTMDGSKTGVFPQTYVEPQSAQ